MVTKRDSSLKQSLRAKRDELKSEVDSKLREQRMGGRSIEPADSAENANNGNQEDITFAVLGYKSTEVNRYNEALARLEQGTYGNCSDCGEEIAEKRLRAQPFAVRCKDCEEAVEQAAARTQTRSAFMGVAHMPA